MRRAGGRKLAATIVTAFALVGGLVVLGPTAKAATPRWDCAAPSQSDCTAFFGVTFNTVQDRYTNTTNATLSATQATYFKCVATNCTELATSPTNTASINNTNNVLNSANADTTQNITLTQRGNTNVANVTLSACESTASDCSSDAVLTTQNSSQKLRQRVRLIQEGTTALSNALTNSFTTNVTGRQRANTQPLNATLGVSADQGGLQYFNVVQRAATSNTSNWTLVRDQAQAVTGVTPLLTQDATKANGDGGLGQMGRAEIHLTAPSLGTNSHTFSTSDTKSQTATSLLGNVTATQGYQAAQPDRSDADGVFADLHVDSGAPCPAGDPTVNPDIKMGDPNGAPGIVENWTQTGSNGNYNQFDDGIRIPILGGNSPCNVIGHGRFRTNSVANGHGEINAGIHGESDNRILYKIDGAATAGAKTLSKVDTVNSPSANFEYSCDVNNDQCPGGTQLPVSEARQSVRNASENGAFGSSATAYQGQTVEYQNVFDNNGGGSATNATLVAQIPAGTSFASCSDGCSNDASTVSWNLGTVGADTEVAPTFQVTVGSGTGTSTSNATGDDDQEAAFTSADTTLNRVTPPTLTVKIKVYPSQAGGSAGTTPVAMLSQANDNNALTLDNALEINPSTVCFAKTTTATKKACNGNVQSTTDVNNDGLNDLKMSFNTVASGVTPLDKTACITGQTFSGRNVQGCGPTK